LKGDWGDGEQDRVYRPIILMTNVYNSGDQEFDAFPEVAATINDSETGNDVIWGRQPTGSPPPLQNRKAVGGGIALTRSSGSAPPSLSGEHRALVSKHIELAT
jgi:hypothetical protein